jgi:secreted trypsin-like serine protease
MTRVGPFATSLFAALGALLAASGLARGGDNEMILAGTEAPDGKYPYQVRLYSSMNDEFGFCGGSIIAAQWVLTAAHCLSKGDSNGPNTPLDPTAVIVGYGSNDRTKTTKIPSAKIFVRQEYLSKGDTGKADVALIKLKRPIPNPQAVTLADPETDRTLLVPGTKVVVTGWGSLWNSYDKDIGSVVAEFGPAEEMLDKWQYPVRLREVELGYVDNDACNAMFRTSAPQYSVAGTEVCAINTPVPKSSCHGDSGGPIVIHSTAPGGFTQVGVDSWGVGCGETGTPDVYARVSSFADWIDDIMKSN